MDKLYYWWVRRYYRIDGVLDEYREAEINRLGNRAFARLLAVNALTMIGALVALLVGVAGSVVAWSLVGILFFAVTVMNSWVASRVTKLELNQLEVTPANFQARLRWIRHQSLGEGVGFAVFFWGFQVALNWPLSWSELFWSTTALELLALTLVEGFIAWYALYFPRRVSVEEALQRYQQAG